MQITTYKKLTKPLNSFQKFWLFVISENFGHTGHTQLHATNTQNSSTFPRDYFGECCTCPDMPNQTQQILHDLTEASMDI